ncbi:MAG TPA: SPOR domain-containing protein [Thermoanaerobaculia bacterium]|nr:SPOR domain-containing protein [Thermoanaerobaculia bacterium]
MTTDIERSGMDVSNSHEPSYYEIALTNRQVVVAFVILLICLVASFFSGIWIGRESAARAQEQLARNALGADPDKEKPEGQALQEFKFFAEAHRKPGALPTSTPPTPAGNRGNNAAAAQAAPTPQTTEPAAAAAGRESSPRSPSATSAAAAPPAPTGRSRPAAGQLPAANPSSANPGLASLVEDIGRRSKRPGATAAGAAQAPPMGPSGEGEPMISGASGASGAAAAGGTGTAGTSTAAPGGEVVHPRPLPEASASPASGSPGAAGSAATAAGATQALPAGELFIQVFSSADKDQADRVRERLVGAGLRAFLSPIDKGGQAMYRVRIGPFPSRDKAEAVAEKVRREQKLDTWITH